MMTYNFDQLNDRRNSYSMKWDIKDNELPMWVADMDFQTVQRLQTPSRNGRNRGFSDIRSFRMTGERRTVDGGREDIT